MLKIAFIINLTIVICQALTFGHIKDKKNIFKFYTYLQNFIAMIVSLIFSAFSILYVVYGREIPEFVRGLRYLASCSLLATMFIFVVFLGAGRKIAITEDDFLPGFSPKTANVIMHYFCPVLSSISFLLFEREISLCNSIWTGIAAIPSCIYWFIYIVLSSTKLWDEPYKFTSNGGKNSLLEILHFCLVPLSFIAISFILWNLK